MVANVTPGLSHLDFLFRDSSLSRAAAWISQGRTSWSPPTIFILPRMDTPSRFCAVHTRFSAIRRIMARFRSPVFERVLFYMVSVF